MFDMCASSGVRSRLNCGYDTTCWAASMAATIAAAIRPARITVVTFMTLRMGTCTHDAQKTKKRANVKDRSSLPLLFRLPTLHYRPLATIAPIPSVSRKEDDTRRGRCPRKDTPKSAQEMYMAVSHCTAKDSGCGAAVSNHQGLIGTKSEDQHRRIQ